MAFAVGVDVGGSRIKAGLVQFGSGMPQVTCFKTAATPHGRLAVERCVAAIVEQVLEETQQPPITGVGVGFPSVVEAGWVQPPNIRGFGKANLASDLSRLLKKRVRVENDAVCTLLAEKSFGGCRGLQSFVVLTLGTGVGGARQEGGCIFAMEPGHMLVGPGRSDFFENLFSAKAVLRESRRLGLKAATVEEVAQATAKGNAAAKRVLKNSAARLAQGIQIIAHLLRPKAIVLAGGVAEWKELLEQARKELKQMHFAVPKNFVVEQSNLRHGGIVGAASLLLQR